jgi:hypothetical protein
VEVHSCARENILVDRQGESDRPDEQNKLQPLNRRLQGFDSSVEDVVIAIAVSPGFGDAESEGDGFLHECQFGDPSAAFGRESLALVGGWRRGRGRA